MEQAYRLTCHTLLAGIVLALEQLEEKQYVQAEQTLREAWRQAADAGAGPLVLR